MRNLANQPNVNNSDPANYPDARIKDNDGLGNGTAVNEAVYGDIHANFSKMMRLYGINYNNLPDNETTGYQLIEAFRALASKNDFILTLTTANDKLIVPIKLGAMLPDEQVICKAAIDKTTETSIVGSDGTERNITFLGNFKTNEYVRLVNTATTVVLIRQVDSINLDAAVEELAYLKAATLPEELAGAIDDKATTPLNNLLAFVERVNGPTSDGALAIPSVRNGLFSKENAELLENLTNPSELIKISVGNDELLTSPNPGNVNDNFNFNYLDVFPPQNKTMANFRGIIPSISQWSPVSDAAGPEIVWCKHEIRQDRVRVICGSTDYFTPLTVNYLAIWI